MGELGRNLVTTHLNLYQLPCTCTLFRRGPEVIFKRYKLFSRIPFNGPSADVATTRDGAKLLPSVYGWGTLPPSSVTPAPTAIGRSIPADSVDPFYSGVTIIMRQDCNSMGLSAMRRMENSLPP